MSQSLNSNSSSQSLSIDPLPSSSSSSLLSAFPSKLPTLSLTSPSSPKSKHSPHLSPSPTSSPHDVQFICSSENQDDCSKVSNKSSYSTDSVPLHYSDCEEEEHNSFHLSSISDIESEEFLDDLTVLSPDALPPPSQQLHTLLPSSSSPFCRKNKKYSAFTFHVFVPPSLLQILENEEEELVIRVKLFELVEGLQSFKETTKISPEVSSSRASLLTTNFPSSKKKMEITSSPSNTTLLSPLVLSELSKNSQQYEKDVHNDCCLSNSSVCSVCSSATIYLENISSPKSCSGRSSISSSYSINQSIHCQEPKLQFLSSAPEDVIIIEHKKQKTIILSPHPSSPYIWVCTCAVPRNSDFQYQYEIVAMYNSNKSKKVGFTLMSERKIRLADSDKNKQFDIFCLDHSEPVSAPFSRERSFVSIRDFIDIGGGYIDGEDQKMLFPFELYINFIINQWISPLKATPLMTPFPTIEKVNKFLKNFSILKENAFQWTSRSEGYEIQVTLLDRHIRESLSNLLNVNHNIQNTQSYVLICIAATCLIGSLTTFVGEKQRIEKSMIAHIIKGLSSNKGIALNIGEELLDPVFINWFLLGVQFLFESESTSITDKFLWMGCTHLVYDLPSTQFTLQNDHVSTIFKICDQFGTQSFYSADGENESVDQSFREAVNILRIHGCLNTKHDRFDNQCYFIVLTNLISASPSLDSLLYVLSQREHSLKSEQEVVSESSNLGNDSYYQIYYYDNISQYDILINLVRGKLKEFDKLYLTQEYANLTLDHIIKLFDIKMFRCESLLCKLLQTRFLHVQYHKHSDKVTEIICSILSEFEGCNNMLQDTIIEYFVQLLEDDVSFSIILKSLTAISSLQPMISNSLKLMDSIMTSSYFTKMEIIDVLNLLIKIPLDKFDKQMEMYIMGNCANIVKKLSCSQDNEGRIELFLLVKNETQSLELKLQLMMVLFCNSGIIFTEESYLSNPLWYYYFRMCLIENIEQLVSRFGQSSLLIRTIYGAMKKACTLLFKFICNLIDKSCSLKCLQLALKHKETTLKLCYLFGDIGFNEDNMQELEEQYQQFSLKLDALFCLVKVFCSPYSCYDVKSLHDRLIQLGHHSESVQFKELLTTFSEIPISKDLQWFYQVKDCDVFAKIWTSVSTKLKGKYSILQIHQKIMPVVKKRWKDLFHRLDMRDITCSCVEFHFGHINIERYGAELNALCRTNLSSQSQKIVDAWCEERIHLLKQFNLLLLFKQYYPSIQKIISFAQKSQTCHTNDRIHNSNPLRKFLCVAHQKLHTHWQNMELKDIRQLLNIIHGFSQLTEEQLMFLHAVSENRTILRWIMMEYNPEDEKIQNSLFMSENNGSAARVELSNSLQILRTIMSDILSSPVNMCDLLDRMPKIDIDFKDALNHVYTLANCLPSENEKTSHDN